MSHQEKQEIFDQYVNSQDLEKFRLGNSPIEVTDWEDVLIAFRYSRISLQTITDLIFTACDLVQEEQQKIIAENAKMLLHDGFHKSNKQTKYYQIGADNLQIDISSIINPENLIS